MLELFEFENVMISKAFIKQIMCDLSIKYRLSLLVVELSENVTTLAAFYQTKPA